jgi:hypothetical protein
MAKLPETLKEYVERRGAEISGDIVENTWREGQRENPGVADRPNGGTDTQGNWD